MSPDIINETFHAILSQTGVVSIILCVAVWYLQKELATERRNHAATAAKLLETSGSSIAALAASAAASQAVAENNARLRSVIERLLDRLGVQHNGI